LRFEIYRFPEKKSRVQAALQQGQERRVAFYGGLLPQERPG
jgi:hypothetical protein